MKLKDNQWVSIGNVCIAIRAINPFLSGKLNRILPIVISKTQTLREQFDAEIKEEMEKAKNPEPDSEQGLAINVAISDSFSKGESDFDIPELKAEWFDDVKFMQGHYEFLTPIL